MKKIAVLTGAGISAESGVKTFRDQNGLWENHDIMQVASPLGWQKNPKLVLDFYNQRRAQLKDVETNLAHLLLKELESEYLIEIVTQNVDDLHERAHSSKIIHLHGELKKARSSKNPELIYDWEGDILWGDLAEDGSQIRPHIVWFGEDVPMIEVAAKSFETADLVLVIGTSLQVYPAAGLIHFAPWDVPIIVVDPNAHEINTNRQVTKIKNTATQAIDELTATIKELLS